jgi:hypothetical protein
LGQFLFVPLFVVVACHAYADADPPANWPKPRLEGGACVSLSGAYQYHGEAGQIERGGRPTFDRGGFNRVPVRGRPESVTVRHSAEAGTVSVAIQGENLTPPERATFTRKLSCENGWSVYFFQFGEGGNANVGRVNYAWTRIYFTKAEDGSLLVRQTHEIELASTVGAPEKRKGESWYRFPAASEKPSGK